MRPSCAGKASLIEPLRLWSGLDRTACVERAHELATLVGLDPDRHLARYPHQLTSGEQQRIAIARAVALNPKLIVLDEVTSALDPNSRAAIIKLLLKLQRKSGFTYLFISHDLSVVRQISSRVLAMYLGRIVESGPTEQVFRQPATPIPAPGSARCCGRTRRSARGSGSSRVRSRAR